jgi:predicted sugar kinase
MAEYHLHVKAWSKGAGKGAGGHARYVMREGPYSERTVETVDGATLRREQVSRADEVVAIEHGHMPNWAQADPLRYWDAADQYERANGSVYREVEFALPAELTQEQNRLLAHEFAKHLAQTKDGPTPYTLAIHRSDKNPELIHCHLMLSDKVNDGIERDPAVWFKRAANKGKDPALGGAPKTQTRGYDQEKDRQWVDRIRPLWADIANRAMERAGIEARIDHRTLEARRQEQERLAQEAADRGDELAAARHRRAAATLDRPPQPKRGRVLEHGGPRAAPAQAQAWERYERDVQAREITRDAQDRAERRTRIYADLLSTPQREPMPDTLTTAQALAALVAQQAEQRRAAIRQEWEKRRRRREQARQAQSREQADFVTSKEQRPGIRHPNKPRWQMERERILAQAYGDRVAEKLGRWYRIERTRDGITLSNAQARVTDHGDRVTAAQGNGREIETMIALAQAKGWKQVHLTGPADFQDRAAAAFIAAGIALDAPALEARARQAAEAERKRREQERLEQEARRVIEEQERRERLEAERKLQRQAAEEQKHQGAAHGQDYWAQLKKRVEAFWAERDAIAAEIGRQAEAQLPEAEKRYAALEREFYATYEKPTTPPMVKVGWFKKIPDPNWRHPEDERAAIKKAMDEVGIGQLRDLACSRDSARTEAEKVLKRRDPKEYERRMEEHRALERRKRDETLRRIQQERIKREKQRGKGGIGDDD